MKTLIYCLIFSNLFLISSNIFGQDSAYNGQIRFPITDSAEGNYTFTRRATFECLTYNQRIKEITLQWFVRFGNIGQVDLRTLPGYAVSTSITNNNYVVSSTGAFVGDINKVLSLYGKPSGDINNPYLKLANGLFDLTTACMGEYDYWMKQLDSNVKIGVLIRQNGVRNVK